jgi:anti-anti-sigma factor
VGCPAPQARTAVVPLPAEIDVTTVRQAGKELIAALGPGITTVIADMTATAFCDCSGVRMLDLVRQLAMVNQAELVLVVRSAAVLRILSLCGLDLLLPVYPSLVTALTTQATPEAQDSERAAG